MTPRPASSAVQRLGRLTAFATAVGAASWGAGLGSANVFWTAATDDSQQYTRWYVGLLGLLGLIAFSSAWLTSRRRDFLINGRGTAYVVESPGEGWTPDEMDAFLGPAQREFADLVYVPGPTGLSEWRWQLDERAERWSDALDDLVLSTRSVARNDDPYTPNSLVCRAWFPVAIGLTARLRAADRAFDLQIRQRPSRGGAGRIDVPDWNQGTHTFVGTWADGPKGDPRSSRKAVLTLMTPPGAAASPGDLVDIRVLLVRAHAATWGDVPVDDSFDPVAVTVENRSGTTWTPATADFHELRIFPTEGRVHPWESFPAMAATITEWIATHAHPTGITLLGMMAPQEVQLGIGINVFNREESRWPANLWPLIRDPKRETFVIPGLDLGWRSLHREHSEVPRGERRS